MGLVCEQPWVVMVAERGHSCGFSCHIWGVSVASGTPEASLRRAVVSLFSRRICDLGTQSHRVPPVPLTCPHGFVSLSRVSCSYPVPADADPMSQ